MIKKSLAKIEAKTVEMEGAKDVTKRVMLSQFDGAPNFNLRIFDVAPGGHTPRHSHPYEHEIVVLEGSGKAWDVDKAIPIEKGDFLLIMPDDEHQLINDSDSLLRVVCLVPQSSGQDLEAGDCRLPD